MKRHAIAEKVITWQGYPLSLEGYQLFHPLYDWEPQKIVYKTGRQVAKSTTLSITMILSTALRENYKILYCTPLEIQVYRLSNLYVKPVMMNSPIIRSKLTSDSNKSVLLKTFNNGSRIEFTYTSNGADRARGISSDEIDWDEVQDTLWDIVPTVEQCLSASKFRYQKFCGTPKTTENTLEYLWRKSSGHEWIMCCRHCGTDNWNELPQALEMLSPDGPVCFKCRSALSILDGRWVASRLDKLGVFEGLHIPQTIVPFNVLDKRNWTRIWQNYQDYPKAKFINEVLGLSYDVGGRLISRDELLKCATLTGPDEKFLTGGYQMVIGGIDWGISAETSYTTLIILGLNADKTYDVFYAKRYYSTDLLEQVADVMKELTRFNCNYVACDRGMGHTNNQILRKEWARGELGRVVEINYLDCRELLYWNQKNKIYILNRTMSINLLIVEMKKGMFKFRKDQQETTNVFDNILAVHEEISTTARGERKVFRHSPDKPDDFLHSINFATIALKRATAQIIINYDNTEEINRNII